MYTRGYSSLYIIVIIISIVYYTFYCTVFEKSVFCILV